MARSEVLPARATPEDPTDERRTTLLVVGLAGGLLILATWIRPMVYALDLDETITAWVAREGPWQAVPRALHHAQSPLFGPLAWAIGKLAGGSPFLLRVPSLIAAGASAWFLYRLIARLIDREAGLFAALGLAAITTVTFAANDFRPYALGLLLSVTSTTMLVRFVGSGRTWDGALYAVLAVALVWDHYVLGALLAAHAVYAVVMLRRGGSAVRWMGLAVIAVAILVGVAPLAITIGRLWSRRAVLSLPGDASLTTFLALLLPPLLVAALIFGAAGARLTGPVDIRRTSARPGTGLLLWSWLLIPSGLLFLVTAVTSASFIEGRYYLSAAPAAAGLFGWAVRSVEPAAARRTVALILAIAGVLGAEGNPKAFEDWRAMAADEHQVADAQTPVLFHAGLIESAAPAAFADAEDRDYLLAPTTPYPLVGRVEPVPYTPTGWGERYMVDVLDRVRGEGRFLLVTRSLTTYPPWVQDHLDSSWSSRVIGSYGSVHLVEFLRSLNA